MKNKRGQLFALYIVALTLFFCAVSVGVFYFKQPEGASSLVSPRDVLIVVDDLEVFEMLEQDLIKEAFLDANNSGLGYGTVPFKQKFRSSFLDKVDSNSFMKEFLFNGLVIQDAKVREQDKGKNLLEDLIYPEDYKEGELLITREVIGKSLSLRGENTSKIHFPVGFSFEFGRKYLVDDNGEVTKL